MGLKDREILSCIRNGNDRKVVDYLYKEVFPNVCNYLKRNNGSLQEAEDCFQEAITKFYRQVLKGEFDVKYKIHGYIYTISIRLWLNHVKREKRKISLEELDESYLNIKIEESKDEGLEEKSDLIKVIFNRLGEKCKDILYYTIYSDLINEDIMHRFQYASVAAVKMQHKRCKQKLIELLKNEPELEVELRGGAEL